MLTNLFTKNSSPNLPKLNGDASPSSVAFKYYWLISCFILTILMIALGGLTRLTDSGLSMVDWKPILGIFPPLTFDQWNQAFQNYQQYPEYQLLHPDMTLSEFKFIFAFEYSHRMLGRLIGLVVLIPWGILWVTQKLSRREKFHFSMLALLVCTQGFVGWFMVKSGLINQPHISHYRLALHFFLALGFLSYILLLLLSYRLFYKKTLQNSTSATPPRYPWISLASLNGVTLLVIVQMLYGTFMAGLDAGQVSQTYPKMFGKWIPLEVLNATTLQPYFKTFLSSTTWIHFIHRHLGILTSLVLLYFTGRSLFHLSRTVSVASHSDKLPQIALYSLGLLSLLQPLIGILTVLAQVPITMALIHQILAVLLFEALIVLYFYSPKKIPQEN